MIINAEYEKTNMFLISKLQSFEENMWLTNNLKAALVADKEDHLIFKFDSQLCIG